MQAPVELKSLNENIRIYPMPMVIPAEKAIVFGDLHGNAMKLLYLLLLFNVICLNEDDFNNAWSIYDKQTDELTLDDLNQFERMINESTVGQQLRLIFLGDEFADRGKNDFFTALIFKRLHDAGIQYQIHLSNHGSYLLSYLDCGQHVLNKLGRGQMASLDNFIALKNRIFALADRFDALVAHAYKDHLCLIGYTQADSAVPVLFSHAPIDETTLKNLTLKFGASYRNDSIDDLISCIDHINAVTHQLIIEGRFTSQILQSGSYRKDEREQLIEKRQSYSLKQTDPVYDTLWNRFVPRDSLPCNSMNMHGHVGGDTSLTRRHINLDSDWGKPSETVMVTNGDGTQSMHTIPADDQKPCSVFIYTPSENDLLKGYYSSQTESSSPVSVYEVDHNSFSLFNNKRKNEEKEEDRLGKTPR